MDAVDPRLILLDDRDTVFVLRAAVAAGETLRLEGGTATVPRPLGMGHKIARRAIAPGDKIVKYGAPIGSATADIAPGEHVHVHNVKSDWTPTYHLLDERRDAEASR